MSTQHYENFPVASLLCPARLRPAVMSIYRFARTADDLADEGPEMAAQRLAQLGHYRSDLAAAAAGRPDSGRWPAVFPAWPCRCGSMRCPRRGCMPCSMPSSRMFATRAMPIATRLLDYCARSANPVGRLLLHLYRVGDDLSLRQSDAICSALQLINFWQDLSVDLPRDRVYLPQRDLAATRAGHARVAACRDTPAARSLVRDLVQWAAALMAEGAPLALRLPGRAGWELRLVVQGGLRILEKIAAMDYASVSMRPVLRKADAPRLLWRAWRMQ